MKKSVINMKKSFILISQVILLLFILTSCKKNKDNKPISDCVAVSMDFKNELENIEYKQNSFGDDLQIYQDMPKSITVPSGSILRFSIGHNFENYEKGDDVTISKVFYKVTYNGHEKECEANISYSSDFCIPAYVDMNIEVKVILSNNDQTSFGPFSVSVTKDNKIITGKEIVDAGYNIETGLIASDNDADKSGYYYMFSPYFIDGISHRLVLYPYYTSGIHAHESDFKFSPFFGLFCLSNRSLDADQIKLVASDRMQSNNLYPELSSKIPCGIGEFYARFEAWEPPLDTTQFDYFHSYINSLNLDYSKLDTITINNPQPELVVSKSKPCFKFVTSYGKKGYGMVSFTSNKVGRVQFIMQR